MTVRTFKQTLWLTLIRLAILISILFLLVFLILIFVRGGKVLSLSFLTEAPKDGMTKGGIFPAIIGTFYLTIGSILFALPLGVLAAIYLSEYAKPSFFVSTIRTAINTLAGVPSIVFGLFGLALFVNIFGFGVSILSGSLTLGILVLPTIINASEEAIKTVPCRFS